MRATTFQLGLALSLLLSLAGCSQPPADTTTGESVASSEATAPSAEPEDTQATVTPKTFEAATLSFPVDWLTRRLAAEHVEVKLLIPAGEAPPFWRPSAEQIVDLQGADLIVMNGAGYEAWTAQANLPLSRLVDSAVDLELIETRGRTHSHGPGGEHSHAAIDPHTFVDPLLLLEQAKAVHAALEANGAAGYGLAQLETELAALASDLEAAIEPLRSASIAANHPSYAYFARRFGLDIKVIDLDAQQPSPRQVEAFNAWASGGESTLLLWTEPPSDAAKAALPADISHLVLDTLEQPPWGERSGQYDYLGQARANIERLSL